ncbi:Cucumber peeling cupredoxin [Spatholobus suberectus]|nr:Cucumber peeling cupredoxin [Spatholobus suberectus]
MGQLSNMVILIAIAVAATILRGTEAAEYTVGGDNTGWTSSPSGGASFYSNWASNITFREGDTLVFNFVAGSHTVAELTKANFDSCNVNQNEEVITTSPAKVTLNRTGEFYFACTIRGHCNGGQKLSVSVTGSSPAPGSAPPPAQGPSPPASGTTPTPPSSEGTPPQSPPTEPGSTTPPLPGSATSVVATFSILLTSIVISSLF